MFHRRSFLFRALYIQNEWVFGKRGRDYERHRTAHERSVWLGRS
jgi:hypothetical protein